MKDKWRVQLLRDAERCAEEEIDYIKRDGEQSIGRVKKALELKKKVLPALRSKPQAIFGSRELYIQTDDFRLAHDVARCLGISLQKAGGYDGINYCGSYDGIRVTVYGMDKVLGCKVVRRRVMKEVEEVEMVCDGVYRK